jgi:hypothetical protein
MLCLTEGVEQHVRGTRNPVDLWKKLQKLYEQKGYCSHFLIWKKLYDLRLADYAKSDEDDVMLLYVTPLVLQVYFRDHTGLLDNPNVDT